MINKKPICRNPQIEQNGFNVRVMKSLIRAGFASVDNDEHWHNYHSFSGLVVDWSAIASEGESIVEIRNIGRKGYERIKEWMSVVHKKHYSSSHIGGRHIRR